jgi:thiamine-phosphate pyrophosphorylase
LSAAPERPRGGRILCYVTDLKFSRSAEPGVAPLAWIRAAIDAGLDWVQIREKELDARELLAVVRAAVDMAAGRTGLRKTRVIVNGRLDVALAAGADGVHLGGGSLPARETVRWCRAGNAPPDFLVGVSCHSLEEAREAENSGASYIFFGPIFDSPAKKVFGAPQGVSRLAEICGLVGIPVIAIGGVDQESGGECLRAGAAGIAAIRLFQGPPDPKALKSVIERLRNF